ncbi:MAG: STAS domain-containing protein [Moraxellaceae bacterium]|jgi:anti-anti-sigma regulatory factor|nr:MAG: STAS domain-containing protein [Moraxellaceae bacterium]
MAHSLDFELPDQLTVGYVQAIHEQLETLVDDKKNDHIILHAAGVTRADTAGIQLLYALVLAARERRIALTWDNPSEKLRTAAQILGMSDHLGIH